MATRSSSSRLGEAEGDEATIREGLDALEALAERADADKVQALLSGEADANDTYLEIHAGAGGTESQDWAEMLQRMYTRWAERHGYKVELVDYHAGEQAGIKSATLLVKGENAYGYAKTESGVHRLVRISPYDSSARRHTSFSSVWVYPVIDDNIEIEINDGDLKIDTYRAIGRGRPARQHHRFSAVRITHIPTGIVVASQIDRSQHKNRETAMSMLKARLYEAELREREAAASTRACVQERHRLGPPDPLLRPPAVPAGEGPAHRRHLDRARRRARRRHRRFHRRRAGPAGDRRDGRSGGRRLNLRARPRCSAPLLALAALRQQARTIPTAPETAREFPRPYRPVSALGDTSVSTEQARDDRNEATTVMDLAHIVPGMTVADIGAGEGYYTVRLAERVGAHGRVLAQDIDADALRAARQRVRARAARQCLDQARHADDDPQLPENSFDRDLPGPHVPRGRPSLMRSCGGCARRCAKTGRWSWSMSTGRPTSTASRPSCCSAKWTMWAFAWSNLSVNRNLQAIMRSSKRWRQTRSRTR